MRKLSKKRREEFHNQVHNIIKVLVPDIAMGITSGPEEGS